MELLAPAGTLPAFEAAMDEGADAVYIGAPGCNARALARDFTFAEIEAMVNYGRQHGRKVYIAMNSLVKEGELRQVADTLAALAVIKPDALIIQDLSIYSLARRFFPGIPLHASTMMAVHSSLGADYLTTLGFERVVLARELSYKEIKAISVVSKAGLEIFIHGAMCFSYSGLCYFSSMFGGKSSLRGQCVQPCRRRYTKKMSTTGKKRPGGRKGKNEGYLFSMNDLSGIDYLDKLSQAGVVSLKIEGRLKSVEYVRKTVRAYRLVMDALDSSSYDQQAVRKEALQLINEAMGRRRSTGYFNDQKLHTVISPNISGNTGIMVGEVKGMSAGRTADRRAGTLVQLTLKAPLAVGDRLRLHDEHTGASQSFTLRYLQARDKSVKEAGKGQRVALRIPGNKITGTGKKVKGKLFRVDVSGRCERVKSSLARRAKRVWEPKVNQELMAEIRQAYPSIALGAENQEHPVAKRSQPDCQQPPGGKGNRPPYWWVRLHSLHDIRQRMPVKPTKFIIKITGQNLDYLEKILNRGKVGVDSLVWSLPPVIQEEHMDWYLEALVVLREAGFKEYQICSLAQLSLFEKMDSARVHGDFRFNLLNSLALQQVQAAGLASAQFSLETDRHNLSAALRAFQETGRAENQGREKMKIGALVYGRPPLFSSRLDNKQLHSLRGIVSPHGESFTLGREDGLTCVRAEAPYSLLGHLQALTVLGLDFFVLDFSVGQLQKEGATVRSLLTGKGRQEQFLTGNFDGVLS